MGETEEEVLWDFTGGYREGVPLDFTGGRRWGGVHWGYDFTGGGGG